MTDKLYSIVEIAELGNIGYETAKQRIRNLEIFPDEIKGKLRLYSQLKVQSVISSIKYKKRTFYKIYESKMNYYEQ